MKKTVLVNLVLLFLTVVILCQLSLIDKFSTPTRITGALTKTASGTVSIGLKVQCMIELNEGWNFVSFCANSTNKSITHILSPIEGDYRFVLLWDEAIQEFVVYSPLSGNPPYDSFNLSKGYFVFYEENSVDLPVTGNEFDDFDLGLVHGWNTPTYPYITERNITEYINSDTRFVLKWNNSNQEFMVYSSLSGSNPFEQIDMGEGQFLHIKNAAGTTIFYVK